MQNCSSGIPTLIGIQRTLTPVVRQEVQAILTTQYGHGNWAKEGEAFIVQAQTEGARLLIDALRRHCR